MRHITTCEMLMISSKVVMEIKYGKSMENYAIISFHLFFYILSVKFQPL
jgi:hypothetical protein